MKNVSIREFVPQDRVDDREDLLTAFLDIWNTSENLKFLSYTLKPFEPEMVRFWFENHNMDFRKRADGADVVYLKKYL